MPDVDPLILARRQIAVDRQHTSWMPALFERKRTRMSVSPLAFLRGSAPLYFHLLAAYPRRARGPQGVGWLAGDLHVENFGAYRPDPAWEEKRQSGAPAAVFNLNDFDDAVVGPWWLDLLRLATSMILGARSAGAEGTAAVDLASRLLRAYPPRALSGTALPPMPRPVRALIDVAAKRSRRELLDDRTEVVHGRRRFVRGERYLKLPAKIASEVPRAIARYARGLTDAERPGADHFELIDAAFRVAGTGSLGCLRVAALTRGKGGRDGAWILDIKEEGTPSATAFLSQRAQKPALRVLQGLRSCLPYPPRFAGSTTLAGRSMLVRKLTPQEDKLDLLTLEPGDWNNVADYLGALAGAAHRRGATRRPTRRWTEGDLGRLLDNAIWLAGIHESAYLAYCRVVGVRPR
jgi:uncharacterized protein (DUF2252 family)